MRATRATGLLPPLYPLFQVLWYDGEDLAGGFHLPVKSVVKVTGIPIQRPKRAPTSSTTHVRGRAFSRRSGAVRKIARTPAMIVRNGTWFHSSERSCP